jgi:hypothetical protein
MKLESILQKIKKIKQKAIDYWKADYDKIALNCYGYYMRR